MKNIVYVLVSHCDTPDVEMLDIIGVYDSEHFNDAYAAMIAERDHIAEEYQTTWPDWTWDEDMCNESNTYVSLGKMGSGFYSDTVYSWEIYEREVL